MTDGAIHEMSQMLGELLAGQRAIVGIIDTKIDALDERMMGHHAEADKRWDRLDQELRTIKHDQRGMEHRGIAQSEAIRRIGATVRPLPEKIDAVDRRVAAVEVVNTQVESLTGRLGAIEKMAYRVAGMAAAASIACSIIGAIVLHYAATILHWLTGKP